MHLNFKGAYPNYQVLRVICDNSLMHEEREIGEIKKPLNAFLLCYFPFTSDNTLYILPLDEQEQIADFITACQTPQITLEFID